MRPSASAPLPPQPETPAPLRVVAADEADAARWDSFVNVAPCATFFHRFGWARIIRSVYGWRAANLMALRGDAVVGVLPLVDIRSPLLGRSLISTAFTVGGGIATTDPEAAQALAEAARAEGEKRRVGYVELRGPGGGEGWRVKDAVYAGFEKELEGDEAAILKAVPRKRRAELNKGVRLAQQGEISFAIDGDVDLFYDLYAEACHAHGTPIFPRAFARALMREFGPETEICVVRAAGRPVYAVLTFFFRNRTMPYYIGASPEAARRAQAFDYGMLKVMSRGVERGARQFDFGRSKYGTGAFDNKTYWGFDPAPLAYHYALIRSRDLPDVNPKNPKFAGVSAAWKRLPPPVANLAGPLLARHLA